MSRQIPAFCTDNSRTTYNHLDGVGDHARFQRDDVGNVVFDKTPTFEFRRMDFHLLQLLYVFQPGQITRAK